MTEIEVIKKKRGRKPKNFINLTTKVENPVNNIIDTNSEDEKIIFHLPITINEINSYDNDNSNLNIFIKSELDINKNIEVENESESCNFKNSTNSETKIFSKNLINNINTHILNFNSNNKNPVCIYT